MEEAALVLAGFGAAVVVAAGLDSFSTAPLRLAAIVPSLVIVLFAVVGVSNGRLGLPAGEINERFDFATTLAGPEGPGRILVASTDKSDIPGESRPGPGLWYRIIDGDQMTIDEVWLAEPRGGEGRLLASLETMSTGSDLRPGQSLAPFAIDWIVLLGPEFQLDDALITQLDLVPTPLDPDARVFENSSSRPIAQAETGVWTRDGVGFSGDPGSGRVEVAINYDDGWQPDPERTDWSISVSAETGEASFRGSETHRALALASALVVLIGLLFLVVGRIRR